MEQRLPCHHWLHIKIHVREQHAVPAEVQPLLGASQKRVLWLAFRSAATSSLSLHEVEHTSEAGPTQCAHPSCKVCSDSFSIRNGIVDVNFNAGSLRMNRNFCTKHLTLKTLLAPPEAQFRPITIIYFTFQTGSYTVPPSWTPTGLVAVTDRPTDAPLSLCINTTEVHAPTRNSLRNDISSCNSALVPAVVVNCNIK